MSNQYAIQELTRIKSEVERVIRSLQEQDAEQSGEFNAEPREQFRQPEAPPRDPLAKTMADLVTPKQLGMIRALARNCALDADEECLAVMKCKTDDLSKRAASSFIDHLKRTETEFQQPRRAS